MGVPNTVINAMAGGDSVRDIDLGSLVKAQVVLHGDPALLVTIRIPVTTLLTDQSIVANSSGTRLAVTQAYVALSAAGSANVSFTIGFGAVNTPSGAGVLLSHPGMPPGATPASRGGGGGIIGTGADGIPIRLTCSAPTGGSFDVVLTYMPLPTAGI